MALPKDNYIIYRDASEAERLDLQHGYLISCQGYYLHPDINIPATGARIADVATGTAIFLREIAATKPDAELHGFDLSDKMFPAQDGLASNIQLHIANVKEPIDSRWHGYFDVVHVRFLMAAMKVEDWAPVLRNLITMLKPGGWIQWTEDDRAHSVRHAARPVAPLNAAKESLSGTGGFKPTRFTLLDAYTRHLMPDDRAQAMTYGYLNLDTLMKDPEVGNLEQVECDMYPIDRTDDGGEIRRDWAVMGIAAQWSMLQAYEGAGNKLTDLTRDELAEGIMKDIDAGGYYVTSAAVFTGRKKA